MLKNIKKRNIILLVLGIIISLIIYNITKYIYDYRKDLDFKEKLKEEIVNIDSDFLEVDFKKLESINNDVVGYIEIANTDISYPIVKGGDNSYYLNHSFDKENSSNGSIFLDYRNDLDNLSKNNIIYGHGRLDNTMFGSLDNLLEDAWLNDESNYYIRVTTPNNNMIFKIFSVYTIEKESYYIKTYFSNSKYFKSFLETIMKRSIFNFGTDVSTNDKILTLSTCKDNFGKRIVVHAKLLKKEETR